MQIILVSRHLKAARTITIMPRHVVIGLLAFVILLFSTSALFSWLSVHLRLPLVEDLVLSLQHREEQRAQDHLANNLQLMATRLGELQGKVLELNMLGERLSGLAGEPPKKPAPTGKEGQGGPYLPVLLTAEELQREIDRLADEVERKADDLSVLESRLLEKRVRDRLLPTTLPVKGAVLGSLFGFREDPINGVRAIHEGVDFRAPTGTPVNAAAAGVVLTATYHPEFGNMIDLDHGDGLMSRYAHLSKIDVVPGQVVRRGEEIGALGNTGRSTGPHLHFEVRMWGIPQNPTNFLKKSTDSLAKLK